jgi:hypothetical protein
LTYHSNSINQGDFHLIMQQTRQITDRPLQGAADFWRVRDFLVATYPVTPLGFNWEVRRWDGSRFHHATDDWAERAAGRVQLWETANGQLVGVVNADGGGDAHLQVHPDFRGIEGEMIAWAEEHLAAPNPAGRRQLEIFVYDYDTTRQQILQQRLYPDELRWRRAPVAGGGTPRGANPAGRRL